MATAPSWPNLAKGNTGTNVKALQCLLNYRNGNTALTVDGSFGPAVHNAVVAFQQSQGITSNGIAGKDTLSRLVAVVQQGARNEAVRGAQHLLSKFETLDIDGSFGPGCLTAVKSFQSKMAISVDGSVGPTTWQYLFGYNAYPSGGGVSGGYKDYRGQDILTSAQIQLLNENKRFYQSAEKSTGVPWEVLAAIHFRETKLSRSGPSNKNGPYQIWGSSYPVGPLTDTQFQAATDAAAQFVKGKVGTINANDDSAVKNAFFAYNGKATAYKNQATNLGFDSTGANIGEGSPYVMNRADKPRDPTVEPTKSNGTWGQIKADGGSLVYPANTDHGAFVLFKALR